jgi:hypothetical protein
MSKGQRRRRLELQHWAEEYALAPQIQEPEDWPVECKLGPAGLYPTFCGDHAPGFVGLYAIINGLSLLLAETSPLKSAEERMLLDLGWKFLSGRGPVAPWHGIRANNFERLAEGLSFSLSRYRSQWIRCERAELPCHASGLELGIMFERLLVAKRAVIILLGRGHYTVLRGYTPLSWLLFDATGRMWMKRDREHPFAGHGWRRSKPFAMILCRSI